MIGAAFTDVLAAAQTGDEHSIRILWRELQPRLLRYLRAVDPHAAEDIAADTWLEVARRLVRFSGEEGDFRAWMFTIARHRLIDHRRRSARRHTAPVDWIPERPAEDDPESDTLHALSMSRAVSLIATLPPDQAEVILLRVLAGLDVARVAEIVGKRPGNVRVLQHRGLRRLASTLSHREELVPARVG